MKYCLGKGSTFEWVQWMKSQFYLSNEWLISGTSAQMDWLSASLCLLPCFVTSCRGVGSLNLQILPLFIYLCKLSTANVCTYFSVILGGQSPLYLRITITKTSLHLTPPLKSGHMAFVALFHRILKSRASILSALEVLNRYAAILLHSF